MIKKLLIGLSISLAPVIALAAYNDVSLGTSAIISINDSLGNAVSLTVAGSSDVVESITVGASSFAVTLQSGSTLTVSSAGRNLITTDAPDANEIITCGDSSSSLALTATSAVTVSVSVSANACGAAAATSSGTNNNGPVAQSGGGGGGGSVITYVTPAVTPTTTNTDTSGLQATIDSLNSQITALSSQTSSGGTKFTKNLKVGTRNSEVMTLQKVLNSDVDTRVASSGAGSAGKETTLFGPATKKALQKFQVKYGLSGPGKTGYGVFGPKTKAKASEIAKMKGL